MRREPVSFLIKCDERLNIINAVWLSPVHLISPYQKSLKELFSRPDAESIAAIAKEAMEKDEELTCAGKLRIINPETELAICIMPAGDAILIHAIEASVINEACEAQEIRNLIERFLRALKASEAGFTANDTSVVRDQFERIQKLNNDLINAQRQLQKANSLLNKLNTDLNNRLVKDALTGLVSRYQYRQEIEQLISAAPDKMGIFTFIDLDDFKGINDNYGHRAGDQFLKQFADRLSRLPFGDMICMRIAGDEFGLYLHGFESVEARDFERIWDAILSTVAKEPIQLDNVYLKVQLSAGMAVYGIDTDEIYDLVEFADFAMYGAKKSGKNSFRRFDMNSYRQEKNRLLS